MRHLLGTAVVLALLGGCEYADPTGSSTGSLVETSRCEVAGLGTLLTDDYLSGAAHGGDSGTEGEWMHVGGGSIALGDATFVFCSINGRSLGDVAGPATLDERPGYSFQVHVQDIAHPGERNVNPVGETQTLTATRYYRPTHWEDGNLEVDGSAVVTIPSELPVTVGNAGNQWAWVTFERAGSDDVVNCRYRGGASTVNPTDPDDVAAGSAYEFVRCTGCDDEPLTAGDSVEVNWLRVRVQTGAHAHPQTTVSADFHIASPLRDFYSIVVADNATGERVYTRQGYLASGDLSVRLLDP